MARTEERLFRRFSSAADVEALGEVFDRLAPRLLALGVRLVREPGAAEDLVQATFVTAIERAETYDHERPLLPWLCGILTRHARNLQRKPRPRPAAVPAVQSDDEPSNALERAEFLEELDRSIEEIPDDLRPLLVLRLRHGLSPAEIAHALGRSPSTVRTQLQRGLEKLRARLSSTFAASSLFALPPTRGLSSIRAEVMSAGTAKAALASSGILSVIAMKNVLVAAAALVVFVSLGFWMRSDSRSSGVEGVAASAAKAPIFETAADSSVVVGFSSELAPSRQVVVARTQAPAAEKVSQVDASVCPASPGAREEFALEIVDPLGRPVSKALVKMIGTHPAEDPMSTYGWFGSKCEGVSDNDGHVALWFPSSVGALTVQRVGVKVEHPEFATLELWRFDPREDDRRITLEFGAFLTVSGYIGARSNVVTDVEIHVTEDANLASDAWLEGSDGRLSTQRIPPGQHVVYLEHTSPDGDRHFSAFESFELSEGEQKELHLELIPGLSLVGELDPEVPRPVFGGEVHLSLGHAHEHGAAALGRRYETEIAEDGTFRFQDLPPGNGEIIALCEGWVTEPVTHPPREECLHHREQVGPPPSVDPAQVEGVFVLPMVPSANLTVTVVDEGGGVVEGAVINLWPNIRWKTGYSQMFLDRSWNGMSDEHGRIVIRDLPLGDAIPYEMTHLEYRWDFAEDKPRTMNSVHVVSGENDLEVTMIAN